MAQKVTSMTSVALCAFSDLNISIRHLAAYLSQNGIEVELFFIKDKREILSLVDNLLGFEIVGLSVVTDDFSKAAYLARKVKEQRKNDKPLLIFGGVHATIMTEQCLKECDYVVRGEGEEALLDICLKMGDDIKGLDNIAYFDGINTIFNPLRPLQNDIDKYPPPYYSSQQVETEKYMIISSRGCPFNCSFCYNSYLKNYYSHGGNSVRMRSVDNIIEELRIAISIFPRVELVQFFDDNFLMRNVGELSQFCKAYKEYINKPFFCLAHPELVSNEKIALLKNAGLAHIQIGIQSGSARINKTVYNRRGGSANILEAAQICRQYSIATYFDLIFNNPYEEVEDVKETFKLVNGLPRPFHLQGHNLVFYPDADITKRALSDGFISNIEQENNYIDEETGNLNSPLEFINDLRNTYYHTHYSIGNKERFNNLIAISQVLPAWLVNAISKLPGDVLIYAKLWLKYKKNRTFRESYYLDKLYQTRGKLV